LDAQISNFKATKPKLSAFDVLLSKSKSPPPVEKPPAPAPPKAAKGGGSGWAGALASYILHPEQHKDEIFYHDEQLVVIYDKFPKAKHHFLVMPAKLINGFSALTTDDLPLLKLMKKRGEIVIDEYKKKNPALKFRMGFHAVPSMR
jgi:aprataxin